jgi:hypothetical protein
VSLIDDELARAEAESAASRHRLTETMVALQSRLKPSALARDAVDELKEIGGDMARAGVETVKRNPIPTMGVVAALTALLVRKPLGRLLRRQPRAE